MGTKSDITDRKTFVKSDTTIKNFKNIKLKTKTMAYQRNARKQAINSIYSMPNLIYGLLRPDDLRVLFC